MCECSSSETLSLENLERDISSHIQAHNSRGNIASKPQEKRLFQTAPLCVRSPLEDASMYRFCELQTSFTKKRPLDIPE